MDDVAFVDASPLILLAAAEQLELLRCAATRVVVPEPVALEIRRRGSGDVTVEALRSAQWLEIVDAPATPSNVLAWDLGLGESSVLTLASATPGAVAMLDDRAARRCAAALGVPVLGTLGLVVRARQRKLISAARPVISRLRDAGLYLTDDLADQALHAIGE